MIKWHRYVLGRKSCVDNRPSRAALAALSGDTNTIVVALGVDAQLSPHVLRQGLYRGVKLLW
jgi:hypothetical protein